VPDNLGELEQLVMLALLRLGEGAYGIPVQQELARVARRHATFATVYSTLQRLESKGFVKSRLGDPTPERGGRRKKHYVVTGAGSRALRHSMQAMERMSRGIDPSWEGR
jgi:DNA-binding PadR family transcriptional regulator